MEPERRAFEDALKVNRLDAETRKIYADWLEENGHDDEAVEQRRCSTPEWVKAAKFLERYAKNCGQHCENYDEHVTAVHKQYEEWRRLGRSTDRFRWEEVFPKEELIDVTFDMLIQIGRDFQERGEVWVQLGSESARDMTSNKKTQDAFWKNWSIVTGLPEPGIDPDLLSRNPFSCSC